MRAPFGADRRSWFLQASTQHRPEVRPGNEYRSQRRLARVFWYQQEAKMKWLDAITARFARCCRHPQIITKNGMAWCNRCGIYQGPGRAIRARYPMVISTPDGYYVIVSEPVWDVHGPFETWDPVDKIIQASLSPSSSQQTLEATVRAWITGQLKSGPRRPSE